MTFSFSYPKSGLIAVRTKAEISSFPSFAVHEADEARQPIQNRIHELFQFDPESGTLIWRSRPVEWNRWNTRYASKVAGYVDAQGYRRIKVDGRPWQAYRLIWLHVNGPIPAGLEIDHINGNRDDNRLDNLRLVTRAENQRNLSVRSDNSSGAMGISWHKRDRKWCAQIKIDGRNKHLGLFDTLKAATAARAEAEREYGFHPGHGKVLEKTHVSSR